MSSFRRRLIMAASGSYIQNGLIFQLDGINKGNNPNGWVEVINGLIFPYNEHMILEDDGVVFEDGSQCYINSDFQFPLNGQIEVVCDYNYTTVSGQYSFVICTGNSQNLMFANTQTLAVGVSEPSPHHKTIPLDNLIRYKPYTFSYNINSQFINSEETISPQNNFFTQNNANIISLGFRKKTSYGASYYNGKIYSIRIYNRQLTSEEVAFNYNVDKIRFRLTS